MVSVVAATFLVIRLAGFPRFIALQDLFAGGYIREESVYLKIYVDITGIVGAGNDPPCSN